MPDNKSQHYVPQFLLRQFSSDTGQRQINIINIGRKKIIRGASLREQCCRDYFYGRLTEMEKNLGQLEGRFALILKQIVATKAYDPRNEYYMAMMIALQKARTLRAEEEMNSMADKLIKLMMFNRVPEENLRQVEITPKGVINFLVGQSLILSPILLDLKQFIVINETSTPLIVSDNPVVSTNWYGRTRFRGRSLDGMSRSGLQMMMPLSPTYALMLHDSNVYTTHTSNNVIKITKSKIVDKLNELQWLNAHKNLYFSPEFKNDMIQSLLGIDREKEKPAPFERLESVENGRFFKKTDKDEFAAPSHGVTSEIIRLGSRTLSKAI